MNNFCCVYGRKFRSDLLLKLARPFQKGWTIIELMIVVLIIGILTTVAVPVYMTYIQQSRVVSLVFPGLHAVENNIGLYYAINHQFPPPELIDAMAAEADTTFFNASLNGSTLQIAIDSPDSSSKLYRLNNFVLLVVPQTSGNKIERWTLSGNLAIRLGIAD